MSYCHQDVKEGIRLLKHAASEGYVRASYALGLALRDTEPETAAKYMQTAADEEYLPALQELLPPREMKDKYGEPKADELRLHLDPICLNRLLTRYYTESAELRECNTSHCWNPLCGRWAFKANSQLFGGHGHMEGLPLHPNVAGVHGSQDQSSNAQLDNRVSRMKYVHTVSSGESLDCLLMLTAFLLSSTGCVAAAAAPSTAASCVRFMTGGLVVTRWNVSFFRLSVRRLV